MKKIRNIKELQVEKQKIKLHQQEVEKKLKVQCAGLKEYFRPANIAATTFTSVLKNVTDKQSNNSLVKNIFSFGVTMLANKLADKAEEMAGVVADQCTSRSRPLRSVGGLVVDSKYQCPFEGIPTMV